MAGKPTNGNFIKKLYDDIKGEVVAHQFPAGKRINVEHLAERKRVSTTPVREVLNGLVAEKLVVAEPKLGFFMRGISEVELRDIYFSNYKILGWCLSEVVARFSDESVLRYPVMKGGIPDLSGSESLESNRLAILTGKMFLHIAKQANNGEFVRHVGNFNDRLQYVRTCECDLLNQPQLSLAKIYDAYTDKNFNSLDTLLEDYYTSRAALTSTIISAMDASEEDGDSDSNFG